MDQGFAADHEKDNWLHWSRNIWRRAKEQNNDLNITFSINITYDLIWNEMEYDSCEDCDWLKQFLI